MEYKFKATLKDLKTDEDGEGQLTMRIPFTEQPLIVGLNMQVKKILEVTIKTEG